MKVYLAADHAGFALKETIKDWLKEWDYEYEDLGAHELDPGDDYPDFIKPLAGRVAGEPESRGVILGGSGQGEAMMANRVRGVRAAVYYGGSTAGGLDIIRLSREHNDANILSLGARFVSEEEARQALKLWLETPFSEDERHVRRIKKLDE